MTLARDYQGRKAARFGRRFVVQVVDRPESYLWQAALVFVAAFVFLMVV